MSTSTFPKPSHISINYRGHVYLPALHGDEQPPVEAFREHLPSETTDPLGIPDGEPGTYRRFAVAPITGAMWPSYPAGRLAVFNDAKQCDVNDGEVVYAALYVRKTPQPRRWWQCKPKVHPHAGFQNITAIRRYGHDEQGRVTLTPLQTGFKAWTQGECDGQQAEILILGVSAGYRPRGYHVSGVQV